MFVDSADFISKIAKKGVTKASSIIVTKIETKNLEEIELMLNQESTLEIVVTANQSFNYTFNLKENSKLKLIILSNCHTEDFEFNLTVNLIDKKAISEVYFLNNQTANLIATTIYIQHLSKNTISQTVVKSINSDASKFKAKAEILINKNCGNSQANMSLKGLLLDTNSNISFQPNLKILENEVTCSHGATISTFEKEYLDYFQSRGITKKQAKNILAKSFESDITSKIPLICL